VKKIVWRLLPLLLLMIMSRVWDALPTPTPIEPLQTVTGQYGEAGLYQEFVPQGRAGLLRVTGMNLASVEAVVFDQALTFFSQGEDTYYAVFAVPIPQKARAYDLPVTLRTKQGQTETLTLSLTVDNGGFLTQDVLLIGEKAFLVNPEIEEAELTHLFDLAAPVTKERLWDTSGFHAPVQGELTSPFGAVRVFNGNFNTLHTGWDYQVGVGQPVMAAASGTVAFAGRLDIRGNYVLIDHGYGIYSGYAHMSVLYVTQGQPIKAGQIIGQVGTTGRSSSPHAHFEMIVNGEWVDPVDFLGLPLPQ
jgi:murein DD-endopeptidase MepM/ murein hydrolase activator NlpD